MRFDEFDSFVQDSSNRDRIHPVPRLLEDFTTYGRPLLWLRLVALADLCNKYVELEGAAIGMTPRRIDVVALIAASEDEYIYERRTRYREIVAEQTQRLAAG